MHYWKSLTCAALASCFAMSASSQADTPPTPPEQPRYELFLIGPDGKKLHLQSIQPSPGDDFTSVDAPAKPPRFVIGVVLSELPAELRARLGMELGEGTGLLIKEVFNGKPAEKAGVQAKDILIAVNDSPVTEPDDVVTTINELKGEPVTMTFFRSGKLINLTIDPIENPNHDLQIRDQISEEAMKKLQELGLQPGSQIVGPGVVLGSSPVISQENIELRAKVRQLEDRLNQLEKQLKTLTEQLGSKPTPTAPVESTDQN
ncbi:PDZ domain-containing protein [Planctomicrobium sp. SH527]|uniref:PDZ domain-containing protein n=1 Tax=Planctomicrobium sp. SH527 TaxID=3448123 RepID=UPI003F5B0E4B